MSETPENVRKRQRHKPVHRWSTAETEALLQDIIEEHRNDPNQKLMGERFYSRIIARRPLLKDMEWKTLRSKMHNMKAVYMSTRDWKRDSEANGLTRAQISDHIYKICPYWNQLLLIFGNEQNLSKSPFVKNESIDMDSWSSGDEQEYSGDNTADIAGQHFLAEFNGVQQEFATGINGSADPNVEVTQSLTTNASTTTWMDQAHNHSFALQQNVQEFNAPPTACGSTPRRHHLHEQSDKRPRIAHNSSNGQQNEERKAVDSDWPEIASITDSGIPIPGLQQQQQLNAMETMQQQERYNFKRELKMMELASQEKIAMANIQAKLEMDKLRLEMKERIKKMELELKYKHESV